MLQGGKPIITIEVTELQPEPAPDSESFRPPGGATEWPACDNPQMPKAVRVPSPPFPEALRKKGITGMVTLYLLVDVHGTVQEAEVLQSDHPQFGTVALETVKQHWRFQPAMCGDVPVPFELMMETQFRLY
jgi:protein TonB